LQARCRERRTVHKPRPAFNQNLPVLPVLLVSSASAKCSIKKR